MFEKLKDFFYDISDVILSIVIIIIMVYTISWKLSDTISYSPNIKVPIIQTEKLNTEDTHSKELNESLVISETPNTSTETAEPIENVDSVNSPDDSLENNETEVAKPSNEDINIITIKEINFVVAEGSSGSRIAKKLQSEGLIDDVTLFLNRLESLSLGNKLRSGTFKLSTDMDMDQVIYKLTGK